MEEKLSDTVLNQFAEHCKHLKEFKVLSDDEGFNDQNRASMMDLVTKILEQQEGNQMERLHL